MSIKTIYNQFYGDDTRWWVGVVESVDDPLTQGRVRVRIHGIHSAAATEIPPESLPWAQVLAPITQGGTSGINGTPVGIQPYAQVFGIFLDGKHSQLPLVLGSIPRVDGERADENAGPVAGGRGAPATAPVGETSSANTNRKVNPDANDPRGEAARTNDQGNPILNDRPDLNDPRGEAARTQVTYRKPVPITPPAGTSPIPGTVRKDFTQLEGGTNEEKCYNFLEKYFRENEGLANSKELAAGFCGNLHVESRYDPFIENGIGAVGLAQWLGERRAQLLTWAADEGYELTRTKTYPGGKAGNYRVPGLEAQLRFIAKELDDNYGRWDSWKNNANTAELAADRVEAFYEISEFSVAFLKGKEKIEANRWKNRPFEERKNSGRGSVGKYDDRLKRANDVYMSFAVKGGV